MLKKHRKVSKDLFPYLKRVLKESNVDYISREKDSFVEIEVEMSSRQFSDFVEDAKCEVERFSDGCPDIPVVSYRTAIHPEKLGRVLEKYNTHCYFILEADKNKWREFCAQ